MRKTYITISEDKGTVVKVTDNNKLTFEVNVAENRQLKLEPENNRIIILPHPNEVALNNFKINWNEIQDKLGTANITEYYNKLIELRAFKPAGGTAGQTQIANTQDITQETKPGVYHLTQDIIGNGTVQNPQYPAGNYLIIGGNIYPSSEQGDFIENRSNYPSFLKNKTWVREYNIGVGGGTITPNQNHSNQYIIKKGQGALNIHYNGFDTNIPNLQWTETYIAIEGEIDIVTHNTVSGILVKDFGANLELDDNGDYFIIPAGSSVKAIYNRYTKEIYLLGHNQSVDYGSLKFDLKGTIDVTLNNNVADIEMDKAVAFQLTELTADTTINFKNLQENKQVKLYIKGNFGLTFTAENNVPVDTDAISYDGNNWNIIVAEVSKVNSNLLIKLYQ